MKTAHRDPSGMTEIDTSFGGRVSMNVGMNKPTPGDCAGKPQVK